MSAVHSQCNSLARIASSFERFASQVIEDNAYASKVGATIVDAYVNPDGRENETRVKCYPTTLRASVLTAHVERVIVLARLSAHVDPDDEDASKRVETAARVAVSKLAHLDADLWHAFTSSAKQHLEDGRDAAILEIDGFAWTDSRKGHVTEIRNREDAQNYSKAHKASHAYLSSNAYVSEDDMIDALTEGW